MTDNEIEELVAELFHSLLETPLSGFIAAWKTGCTLAGIPTNGVAARDIVSIVRAFDRYMGRRVSSTS